MVLKRHRWVNVALRGASNDKGKLIRRDWPLQLCNLAISHNSFHVELDCYRLV